MQNENVKMQRFVTAPWLNSATHHQMEWQIYKIDIDYINRYVLWRTVWCGVCVYSYSLFERKNPAANHRIVSYMLHSIRPQSTLFI